MRAIREGVYAGIVLGRRAGPAAAPRRCSCSIALAGGRRIPPPALVRSPRSPRSPAASRGSPVWSTPGSACRTHDLQDPPRPEGLGRLGRLRVRELAEKGAPALLAGADDVLQLRGGVRPAGVRRQGDVRGPQARGQPAAPGESRAQLREGPAPRSTRSETRTASCTRCGASAPAAKGSGSACHGRRCSTRSPGDQASDLERTGATRSFTTSAARARTSTRSGVLQAGASTATTATRTSARRSRALGTRSVVRRRPPNPDHENARSF